MSSIFLSWMVTSISLLVTAAIMPGISFSSARGAVNAAFVLGIVNYTIKPVLKLFTLPLTIITLGFFSWVVNAISLCVVAKFTAGFQIQTFTDAFLGSFLMHFVSRGFYMVLDNEYYRGNSIEANQSDCEIDRR